MLVGMRKLALENELEASGTLPSLPWPTDGTCGMVIHPIMGLLTMVYPYYWIDDHPPIYWYICHPPFDRGTYWASLCENVKLYVTLPSSLCHPLAIYIFHDIT
jgi:hypothetical protein